MKQSIVIYLIIVLGSLYGCSKPYYLEPDQSGARIVIEGRISNLRGPYFFRITRSSPGINPFWDSGYAIVNPVKDALVILSDDMGTTDTLIPAPQQDTFFSYTFPQGRLDSFQRFHAYLTQDGGYYRTTKIKGIPGHGYYLKVIVDGREFTASDSIPSVPVLDSIGVERDDFHQWANYYIYFREPQNETNYYCVEIDMADYFRYDRQRHATAPEGIYRNWLVEDKILAHEVNRLLIPYPVEFPVVPWYDPMQIRLWNLSKGSWKYFKALHELYFNEGEVYRPAPALPPTNIRGGALGYFMAGSADLKIYVPE